MNFEIGCCLHELVWDHLELSNMAITKIKNKIGQVRGRVLPFHFLLHINHRHRIRASQGKYIWSRF